jgi:DNA-directed RNA polymerase subunit alpha
MVVKYGKFEMPEKIKIDEESSTNLFTRFIAEPFEKGFGHTVGNAFRRILLSSLESPAIVSVRFENVRHEYTAIEGIIEDMTHIVLNLKEALLRLIPTVEENVSKETRLITHTLIVTDQMIEKAKGSYKVTLKELFPANMPFEVVNPDHVIFTVTKPLEKRVDFRIAFGRGYVPQERQKGFDKVVDEIVIDSIFSPVRLVNYYVENTRVGQDTDYDRLILEITTDGRISPKEAVNFAQQIAIEHFKIFDVLKMHEITFEKEVEEKNKDRDEVLSKLALKINEIELSVRSTNCLAQANIDTIGELVVMPEAEMLKFRNFGKKSLTEIKQKLGEMGLSLGMDLSKYGINRDNIKTIIQKYLEERMGNES